ncbi:unnamed protein product [Rangifer tarandus platyrhynchus]|uniref:Uncharacterized protein n=2 Tax=Rangifer tarandus platyrhynchus TaxID=3082113 RepID=A0ACB0DU89_RANTA|nr:unnamed protein product [Rangifer tarandus platyrhynchus]CAI9691783.1 unnamed protein product [Rangifer tarandus platyrhynchus]
MKRPIDSAGGDNRVHPEAPSCSRAHCLAGDRPHRLTFLPHSPALRQLGRPSLPQGAAASPQPIGILGPSRPSHELALRAERRSNARPPPSLGGSEPRGEGRAGKGRARGLPARSPKWPSSFRERCGGP